MVMLQILKPCDGDFFRDKIMKQAANPHDVYELVRRLGIKAKPSPTNFHPVHSMQLQKWTGKTWKRCGEGIEGA